MSLLENLAYADQCYVFVDTLSYHITHIITTYYHLTLLGLRHQ